MKSLDKKWILIIGGLLLLALFYRQNYLELRAEEPRRAIVALEMLLSGNWIVPKINGWDYYNKPPLFNWVLALFYKIFNSSANWVVRLPGMLSLLGMGYLTWKVAKQYLNPTLALIAAGMLVSSGDLFFYSTIVAGEIDVFFSLLVMLQLLSIFHFSMKQQWLQLFAYSYLFCALGVITKGPPSLLFQGLTLLVWLIAEKKWKYLFHWTHFLGLGVMTLLCGAYFYAYAQEADLAALLIRLTKEATMKSGLETKLSDTIIQSLSYPGLWMLWLAPWSLLSLLFFSKQRIKALWEQPLLRFSILFILVNIPVYWVTGSPKCRYVYMFFPFYCFLLVKLWSLFYETLTENKRIKWDQALKMPLWIFPIAAVIASIWQIGWEDNLTAGIGFLLLAIGSIFLLIKARPLEWMYNWLIILALARIGYSLGVYPVTAAQLQVHHEKEVEHMLTLIPEKDTLLYYGAPFIFKSDARFGPINLGNATLVTAPLMAYQIPYHYSGKTGKILRFSTELEPGRYYLCNESTLDTTRMTVMYEFSDGWIRVNDHVTQQYLIQAR